MTSATSRATGVPAVSKKQKLKELKEALQRVPPNSIAYSRINEEILDLEDEIYGYN
jgi:hypothetical protein